MAKIFLLSALLHCVIMPSSEAVFDQLQEATHEYLGEIPGAPRPLIRLKVNTMPTLLRHERKREAALNPKSIINNKNIASKRLIAP
jgi:hypothetical protein